MRQLLAIILVLSNGVLWASDLGKKTYDITCKSCHSPEFSKAIHAPEAFNKKAWDERFKNAEIEAKNNPTQFKTAKDYLLYRVSIGKGLMPHGGLCKETEVPNKNCSDEAISQAIDYMAGR